MDNTYREFHGIRVPDPFHRLEDTTDPRVKDWVRGQTARTDSFLAHCTELARCREFLERNHPALAPEWTCIRNGREFALVRRAGAVQPILVMRENGVERVLIDPNESGEVLHEDDLSVSPSGRYIACSLSAPGGIAVKLRVYECESGHIVDASTFATTTPMFAWHHGEHGFFYTLSRALFNDEGDPRHDGVYWHRLGSDWQTDPCIQAYRGSAGGIAFALLPQNMDHLVIGTFHFSSWHGGASVCRLADVDLEGARLPPLFELFGEAEGFNLFLGAAHGELYFHTCRDAPMGRIVAVDPEHPQPAAWRTVVPQGEFALARPERFPGPQRIAVCDRGLLLTYVKHARHVLCEYGLDGKRRRTIPLPPCTVDSVRAWGGVFRVTAQSFLVPRILYELSPGKGGLKEIRRIELPEVNGADYVLRQAFVRAKDGVRIPMFLLYRRGLPRDGTAPTLLYGYGGFNQAITSEYSPEIALWLELGGVYAQANIRGGGEYGEVWHAAGSRENKQTTFDDFYAAAEYLIAQKYTRPERLAARGVSNGGLLTAVAGNQRPDLFAAVISEVPLMDMLRLDDDAIGQALGAEYGTPLESRTMFDVLRSYSPVHNVRAGGPAQMVVVASEDASAPPGQAYKFVAARQAAEADHETAVPVLLRVVQGEGHTGWRPESIRRTLAEEIAFLRHVLLYSKAPTQ